jgi:hypothetical protein
VPQGAPLGRAPQQESVAGNGAALRAGRRLDVVTAQEGGAGPTADVAVSRTLSTQATSTKSAEARAMVQLPPLGGGKHANAATEPTKRSLAEGGNEPAEPSQGGWHRSLHCGIVAGRYRSNEGLRCAHRANVVAMASISGFTRRLRAFAALPADVAALRQTIDEMNHIIVTLVPSIQHTISTLSHDVHSNAEDVLPLFVGYAERLRLDADTAIGATQVIERQLSELEHTLASLRRDG